MRTGDTTVVALRCPVESQERLMNFGEDADRRRQLLQHPMLVHALFAEDSVIRDTYFLKQFAEPLYGLVSIQVFNVEALVYY